MILYISSIIIFLLVSFNLFFRTDCNNIIKICGIILIFIISMKYVIYEFIGGAFFSPDLPRPVIITLEALYGSLIILFFLLLIWDLYLAGNWLLTKTGIPIPKNIPTGFIKSCLVCIALGLGILGTWQAIKIPTVRDITLHLSKLPRSLDGIIVVQLSDLHIGPILDKAWLEKVVQKTNNCEPDIIALTGDFVDGRVSKLESEIQPLGELKAKYGVFGVTGNHEYYWNAEEWAAALDKLGITMLSNSHKSLNINDETLVIAGLPDLVATRFGFEQGDIKKALGDAPEAVRILLAHQPKDSREYSPYADLHLAGHTHGGIMFFLQPLVSRFNNGFVSGLYPVNASNLYVSPGTGLWNGFSCRIGVPAEITKIILKAE